MQTAREDEMPDPDGYRYTWAAWAEAFTIFAKYQPKERAGQHVAAEHDEIYAGPDPRVVAEDDLRRLDALGWRQMSDLECFARFT